MKVRCITLGAFQVNAYLLEDPATGACAVVDTGEGSASGEALAKMDPRPDLRAILLTHAHFDHAGGLADVQREFPEASPICRRWSGNCSKLLPKQGSLLFGMAEFDRPCGRIDRYIEDGDTVEVGDVVVSLPVHPGPHAGPGLLLRRQICVLGDTLFAGSIGRTDFPLSDPELMSESLRRLLAFARPSDRVQRPRPGHHAGRRAARQPVSGLPPSRARDARPSASTWRPDRAGAETGGDRPRCANCSG
jgi:hydroxyacylglutathione hydrolase